MSALDRFSKTPVIVQYRAPRSRALKASQCGRPSVELQARVESGGCVCAFAWVETHPRVKKINNNNLKKIWKNTTVEREGKKTPHQSERKVCPSHCGPVIICSGGGSALMSEWEAELLCTKQPMSKGLCHWLHPDASTLHYVVQVRLSSLSAPCPIKPSLESRTLHKHPRAPKSSDSDTCDENWACLVSSPAFVCADVHHSWQVVA